MFSGIIQSLEPIIALKKNQGNLVVRIKKPNFFNLKIGDSVSVNGVCSTVIKQNKKSFAVEYMPETLKKTNFINLAVNQKVNLEPSLKMQDYISGHLVTGHVDCVGVVDAVETRHASSLQIKYPKQYRKFLIEKGSMAINGIALTVFDIQHAFFSVALIPHTFKNTNLQNLRKGDKVNLEFDLIGKYLANYAKK